MNKYTSNFNLEHYNKVCRVRELQGMYVHKSEHTALREHPLIGKTIINNLTGEKGFIQSVHEFWHRGWYIVFLTNFNNSHGQCDWENISCHEEFILDSIEACRKRYTIVH